MSGAYTADAKPVQNIVLHFPCSSYLYGTLYPNVASSWLARLDDATRQASALIGGAASEGIIVLSADLHG